MNLYEKMSRLFVCIVLTNVTLVPTHFKLIPCCIILV